MSCRDEGSEQRDAFITRGMTWIANTCQNLEKLMKDPFSGPLEKKANSTNLVLRL